MGLEPYDDIESEIQRIQDGFVTFDVRVHEGMIDEITFREHQEWSGEVIAYDHIQQITIRNN